MRCICLSHETALEFWRLWSARNGIALHLFHCRKTMQTDDLPFRIFPSSAVLVDSSSAKRTVVEIIDGALEDGVPEELAELLGACRVVLSETHSSKRSETSYHFVKNFFPSRTVRDDPDGRTCETWGTHPARGRPSASHQMKRTISRATGRVKSRKTFPIHSTRKFAVKNFFAGKI